MIIKQIFMISLFCCSSLLTFNKQPTPREGHFIPGDGTALIADLPVSVDIETTLTSAPLKKPQLVTHKSPQTNHQQQCGDAFGWRNMAQGPSARKVLGFCGG